MQKWREKAWGNISHDSWHSHHMSSLLLSTPKGYTFCGSRELQWAHETYPLHTEGLLSDKHENAQQWCNHLVEQKDSTIWSSTYIRSLGNAFSLSFRLLKAIKTGELEGLGMRLHYTQDTASLLHRFIAHKRNYLLDLAPRGRKLLKLLVPKKSSMNMRMAPIVQTSIKRRTQTKEKTV